MSNYKPTIALYLVIFLLALFLQLFFTSIEQSFSYLLAFLVMTHKYALKSKVSKTFIGGRVEKSFDSLYNLF